MKNLKWSLYVNVILLCRRIVDDYPFQGKGIHDDAEAKSEEIILSDNGKNCTNVLLIILSILQMGAGVVLGIVVAILTSVPRKVAEPLHHPLPVYVPAVVTLLSGFCIVVTTKFINAYMVLSGIFLCMSSGVLCLANLLSTVITALPLYTSFQFYRYNVEQQICTAFTRFPPELNTTLDAGFLFLEVPDCSAVKYTLPQISVIVSVLCSIVSLSAVTSCFVLATLLCPPTLNIFQVKFYMHRTNVT
ncbi:uncharacterized protein LOC143447339 isoform X1 [Clavelina lepadiformis]|uniref:uncharacterized protein LOC143447339 isoform X1 n=1 Tax=Clavelina lepadiformis TaxID=159417 RepID=UPI0040430C85